MKYFKALLNVLGLSENFFNVERKTIKNIIPE
jgi:hypothetical protein